MPAKAYPGSAFFKLNPNGASLLAPPINRDENAPCFSPSPSYNISVTVITEFRVLCPQEFIFF